MPLREDSKNHLVSSSFFLSLQGIIRLYPNKSNLVGPGWSTHVQQLFSMYSLGCYSLLASPGQP